MWKKQMDWVIDAEAIHNLVKQTVKMALTAPRGKTEDEIVNEVYTQIMRQL